MRRMLSVMWWVTCAFLAALPVYAQVVETPEKTKEVVGSLSQASWQSLEDGMDVLRSVTQAGMVITAYRISPERFTFDVELQDKPDGSRARAIGEQGGAVLAINGGFFAQREDGALYSIGYLRLGDQVLSKGWPNSGGLIVFENEGPKLLPSQAGIPTSGPDVLQTRPMLLEPGGKWAMGSNSGDAKLRTLFCRKANGDVILVVISRVGLSLFEAGWMLRSRDEGGFFGCDAAVALDGGRSTQVWYSGDPAYSFPGFTSVHNFLLVRQRDD